MKNEKANITNIFNTFESGSTEEKINLIQQLVYEDVSEEVVKIISGFIDQEDRGLRNAASFFLSSNPHPSIAEHIVKFVSSPDITIRNLAGEILIRNGTRSLSSLINFLNTNADPDDIKFVIDVLGLIGDSNAGEPIIKKLKESDNENVQLACIEALGNLHFENALDTITQYYNYNELFKPTVIEALGNICTKKSLDFITSHYNEEDILVKYSMIESLGKVGDTETFFFLLSELNEANGPCVWPILEAIYNLKQKFGFDIPFDERMKKSILNTIFDADIKYRKIAAYLVTIFDDPEIVLACLTIYGDDNEIDEIIKPKFEINSALILSKIHQLLDKAPRNLVQLLSLIDELVKSNPDFKTQLSVFETQKLIQSISNLLSHPNENVRFTAAELLFTIEPETAILFLDEMIKDENIWNRLRIMDYIDSLDHPSVTEALIKLASDREEMISEKAKELLSQRQIWEQH